MIAVCRQGPREKKGRAAAGSSRPRRSARERQIPRAQAAVRCLEVLAMAGAVPGGQVFSMQIWATWAARPQCRRSRGGGSRGPHVLGTAALRRTSLSDRVHSTCRPRAAKEEEGFMRGSACGTGQRFCHT